MQLAISIDGDTASEPQGGTNASRTRSAHMLRTLAVNAPLPGTFNPLAPNGGVRPVGSANNLFNTIRLVASTRIF